MNLYLYRKAAYQKRVKGMAGQSERATFIGECSEFELKLLETQEVMEIRGKVEMFQMFSSIMCAGV